MGIRLRVMTIDDIPEAMRLKDIAGWNQTAPDWQRFLSATLDGCFVAEHEGRVIGTTTTIIYEGRFAWIGMVLVEPQFRGLGIGTALLERAISYLDAQGVPCMKLDATPQGRVLYEKLGFVPEYENERWILQREPDETIIPHVPVRIEDVLELDREVFGADRSRLLRSLAAEAPELCLAVRRTESGARHGEPAGPDCGIALSRQGGRDQPPSGFTNDPHGGLPLETTTANGHDRTHAPEHLAGHAFGRHGSFADQMGPWIAGDREVAAKLLTEFLSRSTRELVCVDCPAANPWAVPLVRGKGFEFSRPLTRMYRGTNAHPGRPELLCGTLGPEFG